MKKKITTCIVLFIFPLYGYTQNYPYSVWESSTATAHFNNTYGFPVSAQLLYGNSTVSVFNSNLNSLDMRIYSPSYNMYFNNSLLSGPTGHTLSVKSSTIGRLMFQETTVTLHHQVYSHFSLDFLDSTLYQIHTILPLNIRDNPINYKFTGNLSNVNINNIFLKNTSSNNLTFNNVQFISPSSSQTTTNLPLNNNITIYNLNNSYSMYTFQNSFISSFTSNILDHYDPYSSTKFLSDYKSYFSFGQNSDIELNFSNLNYDIFLPTIISSESILQGANVNGGSNMDINNTTDTFLVQTSIPAFGSVMITDTSPIKKFIYTNQISGYRKFETDSANIVYNADYFSFASVISKSTNFSFNQGNRSSNTESIELTNSNFYFGGNPLSPTYNSQLSSNLYFGDVILSLDNSRLKSSLLNPLSKNTLTIKNLRVSNTSLNPSYFDLYVDLNGSGTYSDHITIQNSIDRSNAVNPSIAITVNNRATTNSSLQQGGVEIITFSNPLNTAESTISDLFSMDSFTLNGITYSLERRGFSWYIISTLTPNTPNTPNLPNIPVTEIIKERIKVPGSISTLGTTMLAFDGIDSRISSPFNLDHSRSVWGNFSTSKLNLNGLSGNNYISQIGADMDISNNLRLGWAFDISKSDFKSYINGDIESLGLSAYFIKNWETNTRLSGQYRFGQSKIKYDDFDTKRKFNTHSYGIKLSQLAFNNSSLSLYPFIAYKQFGISDFIIQEDNRYQYYSEKHNIKESYLGVDVKLLNNQWNPTFSLSLINTKGLHQFSNKNSDVNSIVKIGFSKFSNQHSFSLSGSLRSGEIRNKELKFQYNYLF